MNKEDSGKLFDFSLLAPTDLLRARASLKGAIELSFGPGGGLVSTLQNTSWSVLSNTPGPARESIKVVESHDPHHTLPYCNCTAIQFMRRFGLLPMEDGWCTVQNSDRTAAWLRNHIQSSSTWLQLPDSTAVIPLLSKGYFVVAFGQWKANNQAGHVTTIIGYDSKDMAFVALDGGGVGEKTRRKICRWSQVWRSSMMATIEYYFSPTFNIIKQ